MVQIYTCLRQPWLKMQPVKLRCIGGSCTRPPFCTIRMEISSCTSFLQLCSSVVYLCRPPKWSTTRCWCEGGVYLWFLHYLYSALYSDKTLNSPKLRFLGAEGEAFQYKLLSWFNFMPDEAHSIRWARLKTILSFVWVGRGVFESSWM